MPCSQIKTKSPATDADLRPLLLLQRMMHLLRHLQAQLHRLNDPSLHLLTQRPLTAVVVTALPRTRAPAGRLPVPRTAAPGEPTARTVLPLETRRVDARSMPRVRRDAARASADEVPRTAAATAADDRGRRRRWRGLRFLGLNVLFPSRPLPPSPILLVSAHVLTGTDAGQDLSSKEREGGGRPSMLPLLRRRPAWRGKRYRRPRGRPDGMRPGSVS